MNSPVNHADITVDDPGISRKHVEILWDGTRAQVNDLGSTNGTWIDRTRITTPTVLGVGQPLHIGRTIVELRA